MKDVHDVFHVFMLRKYSRDPKHHITIEPITIEQDLTIESRPVKILEESERVLRRKTLKFVKVLWTNQTEHEATWSLSLKCGRKIRSSLPGYKHVLVYIMLVPLCNKNE